MCGIQTQTLVVMGTNCTGSCKSNYHIFTTTTVPSHSNVLECHLILMSTLFTLFQLVLTVMLTSVIVYIYTVVAFNFFRKFYVKEDDGNVDYKCHDMLTVSVDLVNAYSSF